ncbi:DUF4865 family protein [Streptomyces sp. SID5785]|uniref:DUF4865 family protein n=1 Tax=Streptomyces sp. SID5785 TaxID=2690309 RepID=UPI0013613FD3|nr:DUF4865 family protein [Streptomyces sp. SID5785]MZD06548.1 DUF4865 family protein [Streptomyces sp. SID5785]
MHALQYEITLPADYDMDVIRERVATKGHLLDDFPGLAAKAYLMRERGVAGSPVNQYAPFYLWATPEGMNSFLWGPGFRGLVADFGRPEVQHWMGVAYAPGRPGGAPARAAVRRRTPIAADADLDGLVPDVEREVAELAASEGVLFAAGAVDPRTWERCVFSVWSDPEPAAEGEVFQVLHLSEPERDRLKPGRQW